MAESNIHHVPPSTRRLYVIERGEIIYAGPPGDVHADAAVMRVIGARLDPTDGGSMSPDKGESSR